MTRLKIVAGLAGVGLAGGAVVLYAGFGAFLPWRERAEAERLIVVTGIREGQTIAELGAGGGRFARALAAGVGTAGRVYATELAGPTYRTLVAQTADVPNITVIQGERTRTGLPDGCCDLVLLRNMYHHVGDPAAFLGEVAKALRPGGKAAVIDFEPGALWFHGGRPDDASERRDGHGVAQDAAAAEFVQAGYRLEQADARWSRPMWLSVFRRVN
jgi:SAM-dependent methyltransferase